MKINILIKDAVSLFNIALVLYLFALKSEKKNRKLTWTMFPGIICFSILLLVRVLQNRTQLNMTFSVIHFILTALILGIFFSNNTIRYHLLIVCIFLSFVSLGFVVSCVSGLVVFKLLNLPGTLYELSEDKKIYLLMSAEIIIIMGTFMIGKIAAKIPVEISRMNFYTIILPSMVHMASVALCGDKLYYNTNGFTNIESIIAVLIAGFVMAAGNICNIVVLEYYLNVKFIEADKKLQIREIGLQYDYYMKLEKDMDHIRRLSHDIRNHLEALKGKNDDIQKQEYIGSIEHQLEKYDSYYRTGNSFIDNLLHRKRLDALELGVEFKVIADLSPFYFIKNEDLCVILSNILDNALCECSLKQKEEPKQECIIQMKAGKMREFLCVICKNSVRRKQAAFIMGKDILETTKTDKINHGYGIKNINHAVQKYDGEISFAVYDGMFCLSVIIPIP